MNPFSRLPSARHWEKIGVRPRNGINIPLSALRTGESSGIGEFFDLIPLIDWCHETRFEVIQLLPLNDSGNDPSPYNALSSCALNPIYLSLRHLPLADKAPPLPDTTHLNLLPQIAYLEALSLKLNFLHHYCSQVGVEIGRSESFQAFVDRSPWLIPYSLFKVLKDKLQHTPWLSWPKELHTPNLNQLHSEYREEVFFYLLLQYLSHQQLSSIKEYAVSKNILMKGDIPILISRDSADAWLKPLFFNFSFSAGAPPDFYNQEGQYWGFPIFNWDRLKVDHFSWWKERLLVAAQYYDLYRIDHAVGFFRIWAIPLDHPPREGKFLPENSALFLPQGREILQIMLDFCDMLPIAEDLGTVPPSVRAALMEMGICGTRVIRWERDYEKGGVFIPFNEYPLLSMTTVSTHDSETLQLWWQYFPDEVKLFCSFKGWKYSPDLSFQQRMEILKEAHHTPSLFHINLLQEYLALFPELSFLNPDDERINVPGKILPSNWTYRLRFPLEKITNHEPLKKAIAELVR